MQKFLKTNSLLVLALATAFTARAQSIISTNLLFPIRFASETSTPGFDLGLTFNRDSSTDFKASLYLNQALISQAEIGGSSRYRYNFYLDKAGARLRYRWYTKGQQANPAAKTGFFIGVFADAMYVQTRYQQWLNDVRLPDTVDARGILIGGGPEIGFTWKIGRVTIGPELGIGLCGTSQRIYRKGNSNTIFDPAPLENLAIRLTPCHLDLTLGYVLGKR